jgi:hypothetical protein
VNIATPLTICQQFGIDHLALEAGIDHAALKFGECFLAVSLRRIGIQHGNRPRTNTAARINYLADELLNVEGHTG